MFSLYRRRPNDRKEEDPHRSSQTPQPPSCFLWRDGFGYPWLRQQSDLPRAAEAPFDADIKNNSLVVSPDEHLAAVFYSDEKRVVVYDLQTGQPIKTLMGCVTPRNIVFAPDGRRYYVSASSLGTVSVVDAASFETVAPLPGGLWRVRHRAHRRWQNALRQQRGPPAR